MAIRLACGACGKRYTVSEEYSGQLIRCRLCGGELGRCDPSQVSAVPSTVSPVEVARPSSRARSALLWAASVVTAACLGSAATWAATRMATRSEAIEPIEGEHELTRRRISAGEQLFAAKEDEIRSLRDEFARVKRRRDELQWIIDARREEAGQSGPHGAAIDIAEAALKRVAVNLDHPEWLPCARRVRSWINGWLVDGVILGMALA